MAIRRGTDRCHRQPHLVGNNTQTINLTSFGIVPRAPETYRHGGPGSRRLVNPQRDEEASRMTSGH
jgi:hypothetical protein